MQQLLLSYGFNILSISSLVGWYIHNKGLTVTQTDPNVYRVDVWADQSGKGNHLTPNAGINRPRWQFSPTYPPPHTTIYFDGTDDFLVSPDVNSIGNGHSFVAVLESSNTGGGSNGRLVSNWNHVGTDDWSGTSWAKTVPIDGSGNQIISPPYLGTHVKSGSDIRETHIGNNAYTGGSEYAKMEVYEILIFNERLDLTKPLIWNKVIEYLTDKYEL